MEKSELISAVLSLNSKGAFKLFSNEKVHMLSDFLSPFDAVKAEKVKQAVIDLYSKDTLQKYLNKSIEIAPKVNVGVFVDFNGKSWIYASPEPVTDEVIEASNRLRDARTVQIAERIAKKEAKVVTQAPAYASSRNARTGLSLG